MHISGEGKIGIGLALLALLGGGASVMWPDQHYIGLPMMGAAAIGALLLAYKHFCLDARPARGSIPSARLMALPPSVIEESPVARRARLEREFPAEFVPRMGTALADRVRDVANLIEMAVGAEVLDAQYRVGMPPATRMLAVELEQILRTFMRTGPDGAVNFPRIEEIIISLQGRDVATYATRHFKILPERRSVPSTPDPWQAESQLILAFGPAEEGAPDRIEVAVDHGQPRRTNAGLPF